MRRSINYARPAMMMDCGTGRQLNCWETIQLNHTCMQQPCETCCRKAEVNSGICYLTFLLQPLCDLFKVVQNPARDKFGWVGADDTEIILINDLRWSADLIQWDDFLRLLEVQTVNLPAPKTTSLKTSPLPRTRLYSQQVSLLLCTLAITTFQMTAKRRWW